MAQRSPGIRVSWWSPGTYAISLSTTAVKATHKETMMDKKDVLRIAQGLRLIEEGVETIQSVMREKKITSLSEVAEELIPVFKVDDESLTEAIVNRLR
jgi:hypothetical protein